MSSRAEILQDELIFPYIGMSKEERDFYLNIIRNCKDVSNTESKVDGLSECRLVMMHLIKEENTITFSGALSIGTENRSIEGEMFIEKDCIIVDYKIIRLGIECKHKIYRVLDIFKNENNILVRNSRYNYNMKNRYDEVKDENLKGRFK